MTNLKEIRKNAGYTQDSLARKMGVSVGLISKWEQGVQNPSYLNLRKLKKILGCSFDLLLGEN